TYSEKKHGCVSTNCGTAQIWSSGVEACVDGSSASLSDDDLYIAGRELGQQARYAEALKLFFRIKNREQARCSAPSAIPRASSAKSTRASTITTRRWRLIPATPRCANISARLICRRATWWRRKSS